MSSSLAVATPHHTPRLTHAQRGALGAAKRSPNPIDRHVGARVRMRRTTLGMSQTDLGNALALTFQQVQKYEKGTNRIGASRLQQIATALQVEPAFFFEGAPGVGTARQAAGVPLDPALACASTHDGNRLLTAFNRIHNSDARTIVVRVAEILAKRG